MSEDTAVYSRAAIAQRLKHMRRVLGLSQTEISRRIGVSQQIWNNCETGDNIISLPNAVRIFESFGINLHYIYYGQDNADLPASFKEARRQFDREHANEDSPKPRRKRPRK
jgi:DNA-binding XRE family transcriptional regulator